MNSSWLIFESNKSLKSNTSILFIFEFAKSTIFSCLFFFYVIIELCFLIYAAVTQIFNLISEFVFPVGIIKESKSEMEIHPVFVEITIIKW